MKLKLQNIYYLLGIFLISGIFVLPIYFWGIPSGNDLPQHFQFAASIEHSLLAGEIYPAWSSQENNGYGGIGLRFYPPAAHYVLAVAKILTGDWFAASCLAFLFWTTLSGFAVYFWAREWFPEKSSFFASVLYIFAPYHALQLYGAFLYAEFAAAAILPFCFLFVTRICRRGHLPDVLSLAISFGLLVFTHLPLTIIGSLALFIYVLVSIKFKVFSAPSYKLLAGVILGLAASSFQWVKVITEMKWVNHTASNYSQIGSYDYRQNFLFSFPYLYGFETDSRNLWLLDSSVLITFLLTVPLVILFFRRAETVVKQKLFGILIVSGSAVFMASVASRPVYDLIVPLQKIQFPWRWLSIVSISLAIFSAAGFEYLGELWKNRKQRPIFYLITGGLLIGLTFTCSQIIRQAVYLPRQEFTEMSKKFASAPNYECWLPIWSTKDTQNNNAKISVGERKVNLSEWTAKNIEFDVAKGAETTARLALFYYPHWQATANGNPIETFPVPDGAMAFSVPPGDSNIKIVFSEPPVINLGKAISIAAWMLLLLLSFHCLIYRSKLFR